MPSTSTYPWAGRKESDDGSNGIDLKQKDSPGGLCMSQADSPFLVSPAVRYTPYFGQFGVSATTVSPSGSSVSMLSSPLTTSPNHIGAEKPPTRIPSQMNQSYMCQNQPPILSAPSLFSLRPSTGGTPEYGRNPLQHGLLQPAPLRSTTHLPSLDTMRPLPRRRKRKPARAFSERDLSGEMTPEEQILMQLTEQKNLPWKEVAIRFKEQTGKMMKIPALQMKKKRLVERLRVWTPSEEQALYMAWEEYSRSKWEIIANNMPKYGCAEKWPKELVQKKLQGTSDLTTTHGRCHVL